jgi:tRNA threonylcarbamoyladenosine biosynthesis protein TsaE
MTQDLRTGRRARPRRVESRSSEETERLGAQLARELQPGEVVQVAGELGAGKTTFVRGACRELGVRVPVTSPTFTIGQRYPATGPVASVSHLDLYRIGSLRDEDPDILADYLGPDTITFVEWPEVAESELDELAMQTHRVSLQHGGGDLRIVEIG